MATVESPPRIVERTLADLLDDLGNVPLSRILTTPPIGTATEQDVLEAEARTGLAPELISGVLVEKAVGYIESILAVRLISRLGPFVEAANLGVVLGEGGTLRILPDQIRLPDVCFIARNRFPGGKLIRKPIPAIAPDLAVEILSESNTPGEMKRKLRDYFDAGVRLVWYIDPQTRSAKVFTSVDDAMTLDAAGILDGGEVLPGFTMPLASLFAGLEL